jgi:sigma-B regulation protein RsbU (phosphoserine phosphatase)
MTDGVYEQENASGEAFGEARVAEIVRRDQHLPMADLRDAIYRELAAFRGSVGQTDDVTVLLLRRLVTG